MAMPNHNYVVYSTVYQHNETNERLRVGI